MEPLSHLIRRCLIGGFGLAAIFTGIAAFYYLLYRLVKLIQWRRKTPEERRQEEPWGRHPLSAVSGRGRTGYLILCLENALIHFRQPAADWEWVLRQLWALTEGGDLYAAVSLLPMNILPFARYGDITASGLCDGSPDLWDGKTRLPEGRFQSLRALYEGTGWRLCVLAPLLDAVCRSVELYSFAGAASCTLALAAEMERHLQSWNIPLPEDTAPGAVQFLLRQRDAGPGKPFAGARLSLLLAEPGEGAAQPPP